MSEQSLFIAALERDPSERGAFLDSACAENASLRGRVERLLLAHEQAAIFMEAPAALHAATFDESIAEGPGTVIGQYQLMQQIGEGGMGLVFVAEQQHPVRRKVALKVIKPGMDTQQVVARFEAERQALALMDHPNIAKVHDGGETASGRPYFVMELVKGVPITEYCDQNQVPIRERLELFLDVCQAVQHAHQKGIIHRDIKPSNVLVVSNDGMPLVKVIDFGIAKAIGQQLTDKTIYTQFPSLVGTPLSMSPEQAGEIGVDVDTRADIYALGVLLYELLTGTTPFDKERLSKASYEEIRRIIREEEPPKPSTRISKLVVCVQGTAGTPGALHPLYDVAIIATQRQSDPQGLSQLLRRELDWIVMKALEKDRNRRYESASALAADVQRYLNDEPVQACPPSPVYRLRKFARRNKAGMAILGLIIIFLLALGSGVGWIVGDRTSRLAALRTKINDAVAEARDLLAHDQLYEAKATAVRAKELLESSGSNVDHPELARLGKDLDMAEQLQEIRLEQAAVTGFDLEGADPQYAQAFRDYGIDVDSLDGEEIVRQVAASAIRSKLALALSNWAFARRASGKPTGQGWKELLAISRRADPDPFRDQVRQALENEDAAALSRLAGSEQVQSLPRVTLHLLGRELYINGQSRQAVKLLQNARLQYPGDFWMNFGLAYCLAHVKPPQLDEVIRFYSVAVTIRPQSPGAHLNLGSALMEKGNKLEEAIAEFRRAVELKPDFAAAHKALDAALAKIDKRVRLSRLCSEPPGLSRR